MGHCLLTRVVGVGSICRDIAHHAELSAGRVEGVKVDEVGDLAGEVDAVDEDIALGDLGERSALGRLGHIVLENLAVGDACLEAHVHSTAATATEGTNDNDAWQAAGLLLSSLDVLLDVDHKRVFVRVAGHLRQGHAGVGQLPCPVLERQSATAEACVIPKRRDAAATLGVVQEFEIEQGAAAAGEPAKNCLPAALSLNVEKTGISNAVPANCWRTRRPL